jgi:hypothetical protein
MKKQKVLLNTGTALFLFGCASFADRNEDVIRLSPEATAELARGFGGSPPKHVLAINNDGRVVHVLPHGVDLPEITFPRQVGKILEPPKAITIVHTSDSPGVTYVCHYDKFGRYHCH